MLMSLQVVLLVCQYYYIRRSVGIAFLHCFSMTGYLQLAVLIGPLTVLFYRLFRIKLQKASSENTGNRGDIQSVYT